MNNFFLDASDYELFRKALHETKNEPVVINIYSSDGSLQENENKDKTPAQRKNMSNKFEPSAFGKFFGPRKQRTTPVDMKDFSSWKNKNYRQAEQKINENKDAAPVKFSLADFMAEKARAGKYNELDQAKNDIQKPINQLSTEDPLYKRFSLDSYMHKLEEQSKVKNKFEENDDILEPLGDIQTANIVPDSSQDENFGSSSELDIEKLAMDDPIRGDKFSFEKEELDKVKSRLEKIEREASNIKEKPTEKVISGNELSSLVKEDDDFDFSKLGVEGDGEEFKLDDIDKLNDQLAETSKVSSEETDENEKTPKIDHKRYVEINKNENVKKRVPKVAAIETIQEEQLDGQDEEFDIFAGESDEDKTLEEQISELESEETESVLDSDDENVDLEELEETFDETLDDDVNDESENLEESLDEIEEELDTEENDVDGLEEDLEQEEFVDEDLEEPIVPYVDQQQGYVEPQPMGYVSETGKEDILTKSDFRSMTDEFINKFSQLYKKEDDVAAAEAEEKARLEQEELLKATKEQQDKLQARIDELTEKNKIADSEAELKLKQAELEKERVAKEYESKIKELEESYQKNYEAFKKQAYLEKMDNDLKLKKAQSDFKRREIKIKEHEKALSKKTKDVALLRKELKSNLNISKLESDKKLLELTSKENKKKAAEAKKIEEVKEVVEEKKEEVKEEKKASPSRPKRKTTTTRTKRKPRRKIDSDIIGGIDFE